MIARIRKSMDDNDQGFTLIELLVVIIIIGILSAIAIPVFLNQRKKAVDASMKSDARTIAEQEETYFTDNSAYLGVSSSTNAAGVTTLTAGDAVTLSAGNTAVVTVNTTATVNPGGAYCVVVSNAKGSHAWVYVSSQGGLQAATVTACPSTY